METIKSLWAWVCERKVKAGGAAASGTGAILIMLNLWNGANATMKENVKSQKEYTREYVKLSIAPIKVEIKNLKSESQKTNRMIRDIHLHLLKSKNSASRN